MVFYHWKKLVARFYNHIFITLSQSCAISALISLFVLSFKDMSRPPNEPRLPKPRDGRKNVKTTVVLGWVGGDEDGDDVTYDVYFDTINPPAIKVSANQSAQFYDPDPDLGFDTKYYWKIVACDDSGASTVGPIWSFTTGKS